MDGIINLKKRRMEFENNGVRVIIPLDPAECQRYIEPVCIEDEIHQIYKITLCGEDWINPTIDGNIKWEKDSSFFSDSDEELENSHN